MRMFALLVLAACSTSTEPSHERLASLGFDTPSDWRRSDYQRAGGQAAEWKPVDNKRRESINIVRHELSSQIAAADPRYLASVVAQAQTGMRDARIVSTTTVATKHGLAGVRVTVDFVPEGMHARYRRVHVLLVEDRALVNVIYTAREPDPSALDTVLESIHHEEG